MDSDVELEFPGARVAVLSLNRPSHHNALSRDMLRKILAILDDLKSDPEHRVLVIEGRGKGFCSGIDLREAARSDDSAEEMFRSVVEILVKIRNLPGIVISSVHGFAYGGGCALIAASDLVVSSPEMQLVSPEVRRGFDPVLLFPLLRRKIGDSGQREMLLAGRPIDAYRAKEIGLIQYILPEEKRFRFVEMLVEELLRNDPLASRNTKRMLIAHENSFYGISLEEELRLSLQSHLESWKSESAREGVRAFLEKREPVWRK